MSWARSVLLFLVMFIVCKYIHSNNEDDNVQGIAHVIHMTLPEKCSSAKRHIYHKRNLQAVGRHKTVAARLRILNKSIVIIDIS